MYCDEASPTITNCTIRHSGSYGVQANQAGFGAFSGNIVTLNANYPVYVHGEFVRTMGTDNTLTGNTSDGVVVGSDYITTTGTWLNQGVPYVVDGDLTVAGTPGPTLTIAAGTTLRFRTDSGLFVGPSDPGALVADGATGSAAPITFTSDVAVPAPGDWDGILFYDQTMDGATVLNHCVIEYGGGYWDYGNVYCDEASPTITNCTIRHSKSYGVYANQAGFGAFSSNTVTLNAKYPVYLHGEFVRTMGTDNTLTGNTFDGVVVGSDYVTTTGTWLNQAVPYVMDGDLTVAGTAGPILTIVPGTTLRFRTDSGLFVGQSDPGALVADGTQDQITFTSDVPVPSPGDWDGILFYDQTMGEESLLSHCLIEYGGGYWDYGNVYCDYASPTITDCAINYSGAWGIYVYESTPELSGNTFDGNAEGDVGP